MKTRSKKENKSELNKTSASLENSPVPENSQDIIQLKIDSVLPTVDKKVDDTETIDAVLSQLFKSIENPDLSAHPELANIENLIENDQVVLLIEFVLKTANDHNWPLARYQSEYYLYTGTYWQLITMDSLRQFLGEVAEKISIPELKAKFYSFRDKLMKQFFSAAYFAPPISDKNDVKINLSNGTFVFSREGSWLKPHDKDDFMLHKLLFCYDEKAQCPLFQAYLDRVLPDKEKQMVLAEFMGYVFTKNRVLKLEKGLILFGSGQNGKSVFFEIINALLGSENITNYSLQSLTNVNGYTRARLTGKLLNYATEISEKMDTTIFKALISGEPVDARMIYKEPFILEDYCRFIFNTNNLPIDVEHNLGFYRRFTIIHFDQTITEEEKEPMLAQKIIDQELSGVLNWIVDGLNRLFKQGDFTKSASIEKTLEEFRKNTDTIAQFIEDGNYEPSVDDTMPLKDVFDHYISFCKETNCKNCSYRKFSERLKSHGFITNRQSKGRFVGIKVKKH